MERGRNCQAYNFGVGISALGVSTDGKAVLLGHNDGSLTLFDVTTGRRVPSFEAHNGAVHGITFLSSRTAVSISREDSTIRAWDVHTGGAKGMVRPNAVPNVVARMSETAVVVGSTKGMIYAVEWNDGKGHIRTAEKMASAARNPVAVTGVSVCGNRFVSVSDDNVVRIWEAESMRCLKKVSGVQALCAGLSGEHVVVCGSGGIYNEIQTLYVLSAEAPFKQVINKRMKDLHSRMQVVGNNTVVLQSPNGKVVRVYELSGMVHLMDIRVGAAAGDFKMVGDGRMAVACGRRLMMIDTAPEVDGVAVNRLTYGPARVISVGRESGERGEVRRLRLKVALRAVVCACFVAALGGA
ncbi:WD repeat-containing protein 5-like [Gracilariopsis chorda]|uniref:WD repeat-containing protein 5-like n=1 Tax=Gracilariopsis chorda TaxID=448386 RepID=A0A2V3ITT1_9FLOR|nr:WD repeat-containing protein 5-like [Gracilariopsis chorda]|eukprot:PXF45536.1 WD repeat-containing protein 5-like [Gracilariopsis chorda]